MGVSNRYVPRGQESKQISEVKLVMRFSSASGNLKRPGGCVCAQARHTFYSKFTDHNGLMH